MSFSKSSNYLTKYGALENIPTDSADGIATNFCTQYFYVRANFPNEIHRFYRSDSTLILPGFHESINGRNNIKSSLLNSWISGAKTCICVINCIMDIDNLCIIVISGDCTKNDKVRGCSETFVLQKFNENVYYIKNQIFQYQGYISSVDDISGIGVLEAPSKLHNGNASEEAKTVVNLLNGDTMNHVDNNNIVDDNSVQYDNNSVIETPVQPTVSEDNDYSSDLCDVTKPGHHDTEESEDIDEVVIEEAISENVVVVVEVAEKEEVKTWAKMAENLKHNANKDFIVATRNRTSIHTNGNTSNFNTTSAHHYHDDNGDFKQKNGAVKYNNNRGGGGGYNKFNNNNNYNNNNNNNTSTTTTTYANERDNSDNVFDQYDNDQQLFMGNLPRWLDKDNLVDFFETYGKVLDIRINSGQGKVVAPGRQVPNYGFVVFESAEVAQNILSKKPLYIRNNQRINVEAKRSTATAYGSNRNRKN